MNIEPYSSEDRLSKDNAALVKLYRDRNSEMEQKVMGVMAEHMPELGFVTNNWMFANGMYPDISQRLKRDEQPPKP